MDRRTQGQCGCGGKARCIYVRTKAKLWGGLLASGPEPRRGISRLGPPEGARPQPWGEPSVGRQLTPRLLLDLSHSSTPHRREISREPQAQCAGISLPDTVCQKELLWRRAPVLALADLTRLNEWLSLYPTY